MEQVLFEKQNGEESVCITAQEFRYEWVDDEEQCYVIPISLISEVDLDMRGKQLNIQYFHNDSNSADEDLVSIVSFSQDDLENILDAFTCLLAGKGYHVQTIAERDTSSFLGPLLVFIAAGVYAYATWGHNSLFLVIAVAVIWAVYRLLKAFKRPMLHRVLSMEEAAE